MSGASRAERRWLAPALLVWLTLGEWRIFDRLLFSPGEERDFVVGAVQGILDGRPAFEAWQQRLLGPGIVLLFEQAGLSRLGALRLLFALGLLSANALLLWIARARGARAGALLLGFGLARLLLAYHLEYPWDAIDVLLFMAFGSWAAQPRALVALVPLLLVGSFNHETVLFIPLWLLLAGPRRARLFGALAALASAGLIIALRSAFYLGAPPEAAHQSAEASLPLLGNHVHILHNLRQLFVANWLHGRIFLSLSFFGALGACAWLARAGRTRVAARWTLCVLAAIACFGYVNETRLYLPLLAFWFAYAGGPGFLEAAARSEETPAGPS
jgi:hypothetical protein